MTKRELGENYFTSGYNCAQSVVLAFSEELGLEKDLLLKLSSPFGGGMGRLREVCGAVSGMFMVLGALEGYTSPTDTGSKMELYKKVQRLAKEFKDKNGTIICRELIGLEGASSPSPEKRTEEYYKKRPCKLLVGDACEILEKWLVNSNG